VAAQSVVFTFILLVVSAVSGMFLFRITLTDWNATWGKVIGGVLNSLQIQIFNVIYGKVVFSLNEYENHRTDTQYENALIAKSFLFKFVNSYNSLFYMAFFKDFIDACVDGDGAEISCLGDLQFQLGVVFTSLIIINNTLEVFLPYMKGEMKSKKESKGLDPALEKSFPEDEYEMEQYESTFGDFDEMVIQFGFVCLFVVAFPLTPLLALMNNILEVKVDSVKLIEVTRRPEPRGCYSIGTWYDILSIIAYFSIVTNVILCIFYTDEIESYLSNSGGDTTMVTQYKAWAAVIAEHFIIILKFSIEYFIPDDPVSVEQHMARQAYLVNVLINGAQEEDDDDDMTKVTAEGNQVGDAPMFNLADIPMKLEKDNHCFW